MLRAVSGKTVALECMLHCIQATPMLLYILIAARVSCVYISSELACIVTIVCIKIDKCDAGT